MKTTSRAVLLAALLSAPSLLVAQVAGRPAPVRERIEQVFMTRLRQDLGLSAEQADKVGGVLTDWGGKRRELEDQERDFRRALEGQLRPGVAADSDSLTRLVDGLLQNRVAYAQSFQSEMRDLTPILTPVQRAQFLRLRDNLLQRVRDLQDQRRDGPPVGARRP